MDERLATYLDTLYHSGRAHDAPLADRLARLRNMTPAAAGLIAALIRVQRSQHVLEIGTSNGYSAIWFADAVRDTGGHVITVDVDADRAATARDNIARAEVAAHVSVVCDDGAEMLAATADASVDLLVLDAERPAYVGYWPAVRRVLARHGVVAVDNAVSHQHELTEFRSLLARDTDIVVTLHELGDGVLTAVRID